MKFHKIPMQYNIINRCSKNLFFNFFLDFPQASFKNFGQFCTARGYIDYKCYVKLYRYAFTLVGETPRNFMPVWIKCDFDEMLKFPVINWTFLAYARFLG